MPGRKMNWTSKRSRPVASRQAANGSLAGAKATNPINRGQASSPGEIFRAKLARLVLVVKYRRSHRLEAMSLCALAARIDFNCTTVNGDSFSFNRADSK